LFLALRSRQHSLKEANIRTWIKKSLKVMDGDKWSYNIISETEVPTMCQYNLFLL
jgi:hypothetical protein